MRNPSPNLDSDQASSDSSEHSYSQKLRTTQQMINQMESKLQAYMKTNSSPYRHNNSTQNEASKSKGINLSYETNLLQSPSFYYSKMTPENNRTSEMKSKNELEKELFEFEQRVRKLQMQQHSSVSSSVFMKTFDSFAQPHQESTQKLSPMDENFIKIENQSEEQIIGLLNDKIQLLEEDEKRRCQELEEKLRLLSKEKQQILEEQKRINLQLQQTNETYQNNLNQLESNFQNEKQALLLEDRQQILSDQQEKIATIQQQSEGLLNEEEARREKFEFELQLLEEEKYELQKELQTLMDMNQDLTIQRDEIQGQLTHLMSMHNSMLQNDLRKTMHQVNQTPRQALKVNQNLLQSGTSSMISDKTLNQKHLESLYKMNAQLKESMQQQMNLIRNELEQQKEINTELVKQIQLVVNKQPVKQKQAELIQEEEQQELINLKKLPNETPEYGSEQYEQQEIQLSTLNRKPLEPNEKMNEPNRIDYGKIYPNENFNQNSQFMIENKSKFSEQKSLKMENKTIYQKNNRTQNENTIYNQENQDFEPINYYLEQKKKNSSEFDQLLAKHCKQQQVAGKRQNKCISLQEQEHPRRRRRSPCEACNPQENIQGEQQSQTKSKSKSIQKNKSKSSSGRKIINYKQEKIQIQPTQQINYEYRQEYEKRFLGQLERLNQIVQQTLQN